MTATINPALARMMSQAKAPAAKKKAGPPEIEIESIREVTEAFPILCAAFNDAENAKNIASAAIVGAANPLRISMARATGTYLPSIRVNGLLVVNAPPHHTTKVTDAAQVGAMMKEFGPEMMMYFKPVVTVEKMSFEQIDMINAALDAAGANCPRVEYSLEWKPTIVLHEAITMNAEIGAKCANVAPQVKPIQYVRV